MLDFLARTGARLLTVSALVGCGPSESEIRSAIEDANFCEVADDCTRISGSCPFGCNIYVNVSEASRIRQLMGQWESDCFDKCPSAWPPACVGGRCVADDGE